MFKSYVILIFVFIVLQNNVHGFRNISVFTKTDAMENVLDIRVLDNIGQVALKMVQNIAAAEDEQVDMKAVSDFVIALSKATILILHPQIPQMEDIIAEMNSVKEETQTEKEALDVKIANLEAKLRLSEDRNQILEQKLNDTASKIIKLIDLANEKKVGFTAASTNNQQFQTGAILKFENVHVNQGNNYDPSLSVFTCPLTGLYVVTVTITSYSTNSINAYLLVDGSHKLHVYSYGSSNHKYNAVTQSGLVRCNAGSKFWVQANAGGTLYGGMYSMFAGYLYETVE